MQDRDVFRQNIINRQADSENALILHGITKDEMLISELNFPGTDVRNGVNLVCRPSPEVINCITETQNYLREIEPNQYYYPISDLHLTLVEICHSRTLNEVLNIAWTIELQLSNIVSDLSAPQLDTPILGFDTRGAALNFLPTDGTLQKMRQIICERLIKTGVDIDSRYVPISSHISIMRYTSDLSSKREEWIKRLLTAPLDMKLTWDLFEIWLTWGANWFGMKNRISERGPYNLLGV